MTAQFPSWEPEAKAKAQKEYRAKKKAEGWKQPDYLSKEARREYNRTYREKRFAADPEWQTRYNKTRPKRTYPYRREEYLKSTYGISLEDFDRMFDEQNGRCAICPRELQRGGKMTHVDHCHKTGKVRGLLCHGCNTSLGKLNDDEEIILRMAEYVRKHAADRPS